MLKLKSSCLFLLLFGLGILPSGSLDAQDGTYATPETALADPDFAIQGEYTAQGKGVQVVAQGEGKFLVVQYRGGLPGAGWDRDERDEYEADTAEVQELIKSTGLQKAQRSSPTLGAKPPLGAVVLFDGSPETFKAHWKDGAKMSEDGLLIQGCTTSDIFTDFTAHIEFRTPYMPKARGQGRGNSGAYYQGRYETQVLDSFGLAGKNNETGGIYEISDPSLNMCLPPLVWQTYDADFTAARYDADGKKVANARLTVRLNGVIVQQDVEVPRITRAAPVEEGPEPGPLYLQDHGNPVRYRNIWVVPRDMAQEARRARVPGFERFYASGQDDAQGGRLLVGELGCSGCHQGIKGVHQKPGPILTEVGSRVRPEWIREYLADPHAVKPGTTMPVLFTGWDEAQRADAVLKLTNFLASTGKMPQLSADAGMARKGERLFHQVGCTACHAPRNDVAVREATSVSLAGIENKYTIPSLTEFLKNPHAARPAGRMPGLQLQNKEPEELAHYLLKDSVAGPVKSNVQFQAYHGDWDKVPNFDELTPVKTGECAAFDVYAAGRTDGYGIRYTGFLQIERAGKYTFHIGSDDGSILTIDGKKVADADGIHPHTVNSGSIELTEGAHKVQVDYFEKGGEETLTLEVEGPGLPRQDGGRLLTKTDAVEQEAAPTDPNAFVFNPDLVEPGRQLFVELDCVACHEMKVGNQLLAFDPARRPEPDGQLDLSDGCLAQSDRKRGVPQYDLSPQQLSAIIAFLLQDPAVEYAPEVNIAHTMATFNCTACHSRGDFGGPEVDRNPLFTTTIPEMGDEGRLPPPLKGVGDKINEGWLKHVLRNGANDRDYMRTRMPRFNHGVVDDLAAAFVQLDQRTESPLAEFTDPEHRVKSTGRQLVGEKGLSCIKCHSFGEHKATGIQAIPLTTMTRRLRQDWFLRYLFNPVEYRPGTRMPTGYPDGKPTIKDVYESQVSVTGQNSQANMQISAIWKFLEEGDKAGVPDGLIAEMIELKPESEPIMYRNFIEGTSPRGIAVGYPEKAHIAWDANSLALRLIWHGRFIDASKHWVGRGPGNQGPLGDHVMTIEDTSPLALLPDPNAPWPTGDARERGYKFQGYRLNDKKQPVFIYGSAFGQVHDFIQPVAHDGSDAGLRRELTIVTDYPVAGHFRAARSPRIETLPDGWYQLENGVKVKVTGGGPATIRQSQGEQELLVPLNLAEKPIRLVQELDW